ncbi:hypothetical protein BT96DRAFT_969869 [Gymnopus androsaceus JB14]|uniref:Integral membrane protein n=1 Tax=Gymnopus androsaceus JB14 TaxID=1447944 RepID=A0A6A4IN39_9AGAR|nr:hypothetical protein BT96DRAFT_969869 [Gymnopus androsaceus JB14]
MRYSWCSLAALLLLSASPSLAQAGLSSRSLSKRDGDHHINPHGAPLLELNETEVTMYHAPIPESYYTIDWDDTEHASERHPRLMFLHATFMTLAFFVALPIGIAMRSVNHACHKMITIAFYGLIVLGCGTNTAYRKLTPNMYEGQKHGQQGYLWILLAIALTAIDLLNTFHRIFLFFRNGQKFYLKTFWNSVVLGTDETDDALEGAEYAGLVSEEPEEMELVSPISPPLQKHVHCDDGVEGNETALWASNFRRHHREHSHSGAPETTIFGGHSDDNFHDSNGAKVPLVRRLGAGIFATLEWILVFGGLAQLLTGIIVYTGGCRENYLNGCLAHMIKGAIFWCYGLASFWRYLGGSPFGKLGWAWNRAPSGNYPSAEFVESLVIFIYGITNTWMERFGAKSGDPLTSKQIEHIGIAVMFWFAGLLGMVMESRTVREWLASSTISSLSFSKWNQEAVTEPPSYIASFNPFLALVIGVTGAAMSAHAQTYVFQVQIHQLWGSLLLAWAVLRCLTYFFLWLGPPRSILPSRPPTEALGSFFLACGGLLFMCSTEELTIAAMRRRRDDVMMFLTVAVAISCVVFCWVIGIVAFKSYLKSRIDPRVSYHISA